MKTSEIRALETGELLTKLEEQRKALFNLRINWSTGSLDDANQIRIVRKEIARMLTILRERELAAELVQGEDNA